jgi:hypothetical protein
MNSSVPYKQPWLHSAWADGVFILLPPFFALLLVVLFPAQFQSSAGVPVIYWLILIVFVDVAHVYSTLYRTYFNPGKYKQGSLLLVIPLACYVVGVILYSFDALLFWRILAYLAVFHFIRQQYGFMRLYSRKEQSSLINKRIDTIAIYAATLYPIFYWHVDGNRQFNWFITNDFITVASPAWFLPAGLFVYLIIIALYVIKESIYYFKSRHFNAPRNLLIAGTFLSWYFGIVYFNGDLAFTTLNVISHGIPYMGLIWIAEKRQHHQTGKRPSRILNILFSRYGLLYFVIILIALAYLEEGLWDGFVWREHASIFGLFNPLPKIESAVMLSLLVPLLALPQSTHYVLDGFIWKIRKKPVV